MLVVALTGGIGAGKSSASALLVERGAVLIDGDGVAKELQAKGGKGYEAMVEKFGDGILGPDGELDRPKIAAMVFSDKDKLNDLNAIMLPMIGLTIVERVAANADTDNVVLLDLPLLGGGQTAYDIKATIVIDCPVEIAIDRLVNSRGMDAEDAARRIANQITREERVKLADFVIDNSGDAEQLAKAADACWEWIETLR